MRKNILFIIMCMFLVSCGNEHEEVNEIRLGEPDPFAFIDPYIEGKTLIFLGESSHYTTEIPEVKLELIKYLVENHGVSVIAFESSSAETNYLNVHRDEFEANEMVEGIITSYFSAEPYVNMMEYVKSNERLQIVGLEAMPVGGQVDLGNDRLIKYIGEQLAPYDETNARLFINTEKSFQSFVNTVYDRGEELQDNIQWKDSLLDRYKRIYGEIEAVPSLHHIRSYIEDRMESLEVVFDPSFLDGYEMVHHEQENLSRRDLASKNNLRNVLETIEEDEKVIVWAHNMHIQKNNTSLHYIAPELKEMFDPHPLVLGSIIPDELKKKSYHIGIFFNHGRIYGHGEPWMIDRKVNVNEMEYQLHSYGFPLVFMDFSQAEHVNAWFHKSMITYYVGYLQYELIPSEQYDGVIFLEKVTELQ